MTADEAGALRAEFIGLLDAYLAGDRSLDDVLDWEAEWSLDTGIPGDLRADLDLIALLAEEVQRDLRAEEDVREAAARIVTRGTRRAVAS